VGAVTLLQPQPIQAEHDASRFVSGRPALDDWLRHRALRNESAGASRTYVVCDGARIVGYYSLASGSVESRQTPGRVRRNMPDPVPVMLLGRLAVDRTVQGAGLGRALLKDAILRTLNAAEISGMRALLVHALDEPAAAFYRHNGFLASPMDPLVLMLPLDTARKAMG
jgi:GNAT superfamily N-acetyltransferase